jgi:hypothetical protein
MTTLRNRVTLDEEAAARYLEAPVSERAMVLRFLGDGAKRADKEGQRGLANAARDALMVLGSLRAAAEPEAKDERPLSDVGAALDAMRTRLADGTVQRYAEEAARKADPFPNMCGCAFDQVPLRGPDPACPDCGGTGVLP